MITTKEMRILEQNSEYFGVSCFKLMDNAGRGIADYIFDTFKAVKKEKILVIAYHGNNGGDGFAAAYYLGCDVYFCGDKNALKKDALTHFKKLHKKQFIDSLKYLGNYDIIIDALLGVGVKGEIKEPVKNIINKINSINHINNQNNKKIKVISVDVPSGLDSDTGKGTLFVKSDIILTMHDTKPGLKRWRNTENNVVVLDIGIPSKAIIEVGPGDVKACLGNREINSHKGDNGKIVVATGSQDYPGAAVLVCQALASLRTGADLITVIAPEKTGLLINTFIPDIVVKKVNSDFFQKKHVKEVLALAVKADAVVIGPGLGLQSKDFVKKIVTSLIGNENLVLDADALKSVSIKYIKGCLLTPHAKEFELLTGIKLPENLEDRIKIILPFSKHNCILLKGNPDIIAYNGKYKLNYTGNSGMTAGGTGDILAGLCAGFLAQSHDLFLSASSAAFVNGLCGDNLKTELGYGFIASDFSKEIAKVIKNI